jgi:putative DNA methylase
MTYKKKLIEVALPIGLISNESAKQKTMGAAPHYQNLHRWWARRPSAAVRAMLWASLVDDPSSRPGEFPTEEAQGQERRRLFKILERLIPWSATFDEEILREAHDEIVRSCDGDLPKILDPFGGGGAIPMEGLKLGMPTFSGDLNPIPILIQRAMMEIPYRFANCPPVKVEARDERAVWLGVEGLREDVLEYGRWMEEEAQRRIGIQYPSPATGDGVHVVPIAWIWARTVKSPDPAWRGYVPLVKSWVVSKKSGSELVWVEPLIDAETQSIRYEVRIGGHPLESSSSRQGFTCLATGSPIPFSYIREEAQAGRMKSDLMAVVCDGPNGRIYLSPTVEQSPHLDLEIPDFLVGAPQGKAANDVLKYGITSWGEMFSARQLLALTTFSDLLEEVHEAIMSDAVGLNDDSTRLRDGGNGRIAYADAVVTYLAFVIDKCTDFWSTICTWNSPNGQLRYTFSKQAIPMTWDFAEINPFSKKMGSWDAMLRGVLKGIEVLPTNGEVDIRQRDARARIAEVGNCVISTDPPYYDNISYADLSDYFYVWLRRNLKGIWPEECATLLTPKVEELIADAKRCGSRAAANRFFELGMEGVFSQAAENCDERYPATIFYAFKASESEGQGSVSTGWETFLAGLLNSGFMVTATWPVRTEFASKIGIAAGDNMLASSVVLACRKRGTAAPMATRGEFISALRNEMAPAIKILQAENIAPVDMAQSAIGPGIGIFSRYSKVIEADGRAMTVRTALSLINEVLAEILSGEESEFDADTRFAVTWFEQFGHSSGVFGDADTLAKAKNTTVSGVVESGIASSKEGKLRLLERTEMSDDWDPAKDSRLTVWEVTHHLIRALEISESDASDLLKKVGIGFGDKARQLAYLLYGICDRKKWASEGSAYNTLIAAWPEIEKLARQQSRSDSSSETLF